MTPQQNDCSACKQFLKVHYKLVALLTMLGLGLMGDVYTAWNESKILDKVTTLSINQAVMDYKIDTHILMQEGEDEVGTNTHSAVPEGLAEGLEGDGWLQFGPPEAFGRGIHKEEL